MFISYKKESPKKVININIPTVKKSNVKYFSISSKESKETKINRSNEIEAFEKVLNVEVKNKPENNKISGEEDNNDYENNTIKDDIENSI